MNQTAQAIREELGRRQWAQADLARVLDWTVQATSEVMQGKRRIDATMALDLSALTDIPAAEWLALQSADDLEEANHRSTNPNRYRRITMRAELEDRVPVRELVRRGVISQSDPITQTAEVDELIGVDPTFGASAKRQLVAEVPFTRAQTAWIALARRKAAALALPTYDKEGFGDYARDLPHQVTAARDFAPLPAQFEAFGVALVHVEPFPGGRIDGVSLSIGDHPMIAVSGRGKRLDKVLFALLHECGHVVRGHWRNAPRVHEDGAEAAVGDVAAEAAISELATSWCFPSGLRPQYPVTRKHVATLAAEHRVADALIIGNLQHNKIIEWSSTLGRGLPTVEEELKLWR